MASQRCYSLVLCFGFPPGSFSSAQHTIVLVLVTGPVVENKKSFDNDAQVQLVNDTLVWYPELTQAVLL